MFEREMLDGPTGEFRAAGRGPTPRFRYLSSRLKTPTITAGVSLVEVAGRLFHCFRNGPDYAFTRR